VGGPERQGEDRPRGRSRVQARLFTLGLVGLAAGTVAGFVLAQREAGRQLDRQAAEAAEAAADSLEAEVDRSVAGLAGAGILLDADGELDQAAFEAFAGSLLAQEAVTGLGLVAVVPGSERAELEARLGGPLRAAVTDPDTPARVADTHYVLVASLPQRDSPGIGVDLGADPDRAASLQTAVEDRVPALTSVIELATSGEGAALLYPLVEPGADAVRGLLVTGVRVDRLQAAIERPLGDAVGDGLVASIVEAEEVVVGPALAATGRRAGHPVELPGRSWTVVVQSGAAPDLTVAWAIAAFGALVVAVLAALVIVTARHQRTLSQSNERLAEGERRSRAMQEVAGRLARALSGDEVAAAVLAHLPAAVGGSAAVLGIARADGQLEVQRAAPDDAGALAVVGTGSLVEQALVDQQPAWLGSPMGWKDDQPASELVGDGRALALLPLRADDVAGVLAVAYPRVHIFSDDERAVLETVGVLAGRALARGRRYDTEHRTAIAFQEAALPGALPSVSGLTIAARYRPAAQGATVGGDWYDVLVLDDHRVALVVGDVVGHGMQAAAAMGRLRTAFHAIAALRPDPGAIVRAVSEQVSTIPHSFCTTVVCAIVDLEHGTLRWSRAGHPPPLVVQGERTEVLDAPGLPPLGVGLDLPDVVHERALDVGDVVVLYTDGVIERRGELIDLGVDRLRIVTEALADLDPDEFCDALVEAVVPLDEQGDDVVVLAVRYDGRSPSGGGEAEREPDRLATVRAGVDPPSVGQGLHDQDAPPGGGQRLG
jgi:sensor domain CHASE-containing protein